MTNCERGNLDMNENDILSAFEDFLINMSKLSESREPRTDEACKKICESLRVGKADVLFYDSPEKEGTDDYAVFEVYDSHVSVDEPSVVVRKKTPIGNIVFYRFFRSDESYKWSHDEEKTINLLASMLFVFHGRLRLIEMNHAMTFFDADMNIYNLKYFLRHLGDMIDRKIILGYAAIYFNLRRFSVVNMQIGRVNGTESMKKYIDLITSKISGDELICRIGGDNFALIIKEEKLDEIIDIFNGTSIVYGKEPWEHINISASAGIYKLNGDVSADSPTEIMDRISVALVQAKAMKSKHIAFFDRKMLENNEKSLKITADFQNGLENNEFLVYYQPKISTSTLEIVGAEALSRWKRGDKIVYPGDFIETLERDMNICRLDFYVLEKVCKDIRRWLDQGRKAVKISVNLSRRHLADPELLKHVIEIIERNNIPHEYIEIELTETTSDLEFQDLKTFIKGLQSQGISTSVDDFGVGYSSLTLIKDIPWNVMKIDKSFLSDSNEPYDPKKMIMLKHVVAMARDMGLECVAEGVETRQQLELLRSHCCDTIQGYYFDKPLPVDEFEKRLDNAAYYID